MSGKIRAAWLKPEAYPIFAVIAGGLGAAGGMLTYYATSHPDNCFNKSKPFPYMRVNDPRGN
ncbi:uncharacterized protein AMSG_03309 [Thecamonas trahens ATCC 50062]|uniref:NADH-ubiquinone reductase complex 1 MLRQ subunit n=1 Tax=Thecamonas trahens ATCC 50062 TaxID=461836 RepID=A0A0L0D6D7_THETB|nr:hypothetical protein AMSG_03309 [Thecamonas trahens ATCC 50062]KNC46878.1 hypothetical protein AMSG_03309 [Thecamonas trahens ATCC 50062]|eukprot:XP_013760151.1 hypothetical protein AMSG_03309 [Thecamonas trahens ATCC 50062]